MAYQDLDGLLSPPSPHYILSDPAARDRRNTADVAQNRYKVTVRASQQVLALGLYHARRHYLPSVDAWDCAMELLHHLVNDALQDAPQEEIETWLGHAIANHESRRQMERRANRHAYNFARRKRDETSRFAQNNEMGGGEWDQLTDTAHTPLELLLRREITGAIAEALTSLTPEDRSLFLAYYEHGHSLDEMSVAFQTTPQILKQRLYRLRKRMRKRLEETGCDEAEMRLCLAPDRRG